MSYFLIKEGNDKRRHHFDHTAHRNTYIGRDGTFLVLGEDFV